MNPLIGADRQGSINDESRDSVLVVDEEILGGESSDVDCWQAGTILVNLIVLAVIGVGAKPGEERISGIPLCWEMNALGVMERSGGLVVQ